MIVIGKNGAKYIRDIIIPLSPTLFKSLIIDHDYGERQFSEL